MEIRKETIQLLKLSDLKPYKKNPRNNELAVEPVARSIEMFGFKVPIVIDKNNEIICGHTRYKAARRLGLKEVPVIIADDLNEEEIKAFRLADNKVSELAEWDSDLLGQELSDILDIDMECFGFAEADINLEETELDAIEEDDYEEEPPEQPKAQRGDIYKLGNHYLMCGDSTKREDVMALTQREPIDLLVTDPPYNVNYEGTAGKIENDNMEDGAFHNFLVDAMSSADATLKPGGAFYIWHADSEGFNFRGACRDVGWQVRQCLIWNKNSFVLGRQDYHWKHEPCLYGWKDGAAHYFIDDRTQCTVIEDAEINPDRMKKGELVALVKQIISDKQSTTVLNEDKPKRNAEHPTMKPVRLIARLIRNSSKPGQKVLDLFGGSGTTMMACEQLGRSCYMMEYDPKFVDVIINRWETFTGQEAELINGAEDEE